MGSNHLSSRSAVLVAYSAAEQLITAHFVWPHGITTNSYATRLGPVIDMQLDANIPVRPNDLTIHEADLQQAIPLLKQFVGNQLTRQIVEAPTAGMSVSETILRPSERKSFAVMQAADILTPTALYRACNAMLREMVDIDISALNQSSIKLS